MEAFGAGAPGAGALITPPAADAWYASAADALATVRHALSWLAAEVPGAVTGGTLTDVELCEGLQEAERCASATGAARSSLLASFEARMVYDGDACPTARTWLIRRAKISPKVASGQLFLSRALAAHPRYLPVLAAGAISGSWTAELCACCDKLPAEERDGADKVVLDALAASPELTLEDLKALIAEILARTARPDEDGPDPDKDRYVQLVRHWRGAGLLRGELSSEAAAALEAALGALAKPRSPADDRTKGQRMHDALEELCQQKVADGLPETAGQPTLVHLHIDLAQLRQLPGAADIEATWMAGRSAAATEHGWVTSRAAAEAYACDALLMPVVTGHLDPEALAELTREFLASWRSAPLPGVRCPAGDACPHARITTPGPGEPPGLSPAAIRRLQDIMLRHATDLLSGPMGLAACLRNACTGNYWPNVSQPLDIGRPTSEIPAYLRRAVAVRDRHCAFPGCDQPPRACQVHHVTPRSQGGVTKLTNLVLLCSYHHLRAIHEQGWKLALQPDGTTTVTSPDGERRHRSHTSPHRDTS